MTQKLISVTKAQLAAGLKISPPPGRIWQMEEVTVVITEPTEGDTNVVQMAVTRGYNLPSSPTSGYGQIIVYGSRAAASAGEVGGWTWAKAASGGFEGGTTVVNNSNQGPISLTDEDVLIVTAVFSADAQFTAFWAVFTDITNNPAN